MAALDFPASPTVGQVFNAANGVSYVWNGTLWISATMPGASGASPTPPSSPTPNQLWFNSTLGQLFIWYDDGNSQQWVPTSPIPTTLTSPGGDFFAFGQANAPAAQTVQAMPVISGNSGGWYNATTGRFTPPAGRFYFYFQAGGTNTTTGGVLVARILRNGVVVTSQQGNWYTANAAVMVGIDATLDANGTDYFEFATASNVGTNVASNMSFGAYPISGIKGPPGDPGVGLLQTVFFETGAVAALGSNQIPWDDSIPQIGEGYEYMTLAITPISATSKLLIDVVFNYSDGSADVATVALFRDATANAVVAAGNWASAANVMQQTRLSHSEVSGSTAPTTFRVRAGNNGAGGGITFNGASGARKYGGVSNSSIRIQEVL